MPCAWVEFAQLCSASGSGQVRNATVALSSIRFGSFRALGLGLWMSRLQDLLGRARVALLGVRSRRGPKFNGCIEFGSVRFDVVVLFCTLPWRCVDCAHGMRVVFALIQKGIFYTHASSLDTIRNALLRVRFRSTPKCNGCLLSSIRLGSFQRLWLGLWMWFLQDLVDHRRRWRRRARPCTTPFGRHCRPRTRSAALTTLHVSVGLDVIVFGGM